MTDINLDDLEAKARAATRGKWSYQLGAPSWPGCNEVLTSSALVAQVPHNKPRDAIYIAAMSPDVALLLIEEVRILRDLLERGKQTALMAEHAAYQEGLKDGRDGI